MRKTSLYHKGYPDVFSVMGYITHIFGTMGYITHIFGTNFKLVTLCFSVPGVSQNLALRFSSRAADNSFFLISAVLVHELHFSQFSFDKKGDVCGEQ